MSITPISSPFLQNRLPSLNIQRIVSDAMTKTPTTPINSKNPSNVDRKQNSPRLFEGHPSLVGDNGSELNSVQSTYRQLEAVVKDVPEPKLVTYQAVIGNSTPTPMQAAAPTTIIEIPSSELPRNPFQRIGWKHRQKAGRQSVSPSHLISNGQSIPPKAAIRLQIQSPPKSEGLKLMEIEGGFEIRNDEANQVELNESHLDISDLVQKDNLSAEQQRGILENDKQTQDNLNKLLVSFQNSNSKETNTQPPPRVENTELSKSYCIETFQGQSNNQKDNIDLKNERVKQDLENKEKAKQRCSEMEIKYENQNEGLQDSIIGTASHNEKLDLILMKYSTTASYEKASCILTENKSDEKYRSSQEKSSIYQTDAFHQQPHHERRSSQEVMKRHFHLIPSSGLNLNSKERSKYIEDLSDIQIGPIQEKPSSKIRLDYVENDESNLLAALNQIDLQLNEKKQQQHKGQRQTTYSSISPNRQQKSSFETYGEKQKMKKIILMEQKAINEEMKRRQQQSINKPKLIKLIPVQMSSQSNVPSTMPNIANKPEVQYFTAPKQAFKQYLPGTGPSNRGSSDTGVKQTDDDVLINLREITNVAHKSKQVTTPITPIRGSSFKINEMGIQQENVQNKSNHCIQKGNQKKGVKINQEEVQKKLNQKEGTFEFWAEKISQSDNPREILEVWKQINSLAISKKCFSNL